MDNKRYRGTCPKCGHELWICKSIGMQLGINIGHGRCPECDTFMRISFDGKKQEMQMEEWETEKYKEEIPERDKNETAVARCSWWDRNLEDVTEWQQDQCSKNGKTCQTCEDFGMLGGPVSE